MCTKRRACPGIGADPPFPSTQGPILSTSTPAHAASSQPHQYVTPSSPQTGLATKHLTGHVGVGVVRMHNFSGCVAFETGRIMQSATTMIAAARNRWREGGNVHMVIVGDGEPRELAVLDLRTL